MAEIEKIDVIYPSQLMTYPVYRIQIKNGKVVKVWEYPHGREYEYETNIHDSINGMNNEFVQGKIVFDGNEGAQFYIDTFSVFPTVDDYRNYFYLENEDDTVYLVPALVIDGKVYRGGEVGNSFWTDAFMGDTIEFIYNELWSLDFYADANLLSETAGETTISTIQTSTSLLSLGLVFYLSWGYEDNYTMNFYLDGELVKSVTPMVDMPDAKYQNVLFVFHGSFNELKIEVLNNAEGNVNGEIYLQAVYYIPACPNTSDCELNFIFEGELSNTEVYGVHDDIGSLEFKITKIKHIGNGYVSHSGNIFANGDFEILSITPPERKKIGEKRFPEVGNWTAFVPDVLGAEHRRAFKEKSLESFSVSKVLNGKFKNKDFMGKFQYSVKGFVKDMDIEVEE